TYNLSFAVDFDFYHNHSGFITLLNVFFLVHRFPSTEPIIAIAVEAFPLTVVRFAISFPIGAALVSAGVGIISFALSRTPFIGLSIKDAVESIGCRLIGLGIGFFFLFFGFFRFLFFRLRLFLFFSGGRRRRLGLFGFFFDHRSFFCFLGFNFFFQAGCGRFGGGCFYSFNIICLGFIIGRRSSFYRL